MMPVNSTLLKVTKSGSAPVLKLSLLALLIVVGSCKSEKKEGKDGKAGGGGPKGLSAEVFVVNPADLDRNYQSSGSLLANESIDVFPEVGGRITSIHFKEGGVVHKGDLLVQLNSADLAAQIQKLEAQKKLQQITKQRQDELLAISGISRQEYDNTVTQIASIDADIAFYRAQIAKLQIRSPFSGVIGLRNVSVGAVIGTTTMITTIQQIDPLKLDFPLPEQYQSLVKPGATVQFTGNSFSDTLKGKVIAAQPIADAATRTITMRALVENKQRKLLPGAFVNVFIDLDRKANAITIPTQCIIPTTRDKKVVILRNGKAEMVTVQTGERLTSTIEITQGLQAGDTVLTTGIMQVKAGMDVKVAKVATL